MNRRTFIITTALSLSISLVAGCGGSAESDPSAVIDNIFPTEIGFSYANTAVFQNTDTVAFDVRIEGSNFGADPGGGSRYRAAIVGSGLQPESLILTGMDRLSGTLHIPVALLSTNLPETTYQLRVYEEGDIVPYRNPANPPKIVFFQFVTEPS